MSAVPLHHLDGLEWDEHGCASLSGDLLEWSIRFDSAIRNRAITLGATEHRFPSLIAASALAPIAYLRSFPHLATVAVKPRRTALESLAAECGTADDIDVNEQRFSAASHLLAPAACYHLYPLFSGKRLESTALLTTRCQCHRCEEHYVPLERQWSFEMREIVCLGEAQAIGEFADTWHDEVRRLRLQLGISAAWEAATDPFFDPAGDPKALAQLIEPSKQELCTPKGLALASVNKHRGFFGESYDIRLADGSHAHSACVAFGIERWLSAMFDVHGPDVAAWPLPLGAS